MRDLKIFAKTVEKSAEEQIDLFASLEAFKDSKIRIMPDVHSGAGCVIGFTADLGDKVIPNIVGVDIGCGMTAVKLSEKDIDLAVLDDVIRNHIPNGKNVHETPVRHFPTEKWASDIIDDLICRNHLHNLDWLYKSMGSLGGGNHFIEVDIDEKTGDKWLGKLTPWEITHWQPLPEPPTEEGI